MAGAGKTRVDISARTLTGITLIAAVFVAGGMQRSYAQSPAPIVYATAPSALRSQPLQRQEVTFDKFEGRSAPSAGAIDLRPGAVKASFGPSLPPVSRLETPVKPLESAPAVYAEPYAGPPYQVEGKWYVPAYEPNYDEVGIASWYGPTFHGKDSASGEVFDENAMTAAHPTLPIPSLVRVTNLENGKSVIVRLNDRGPYADDRIIDLSKNAGAALGMHAKGTAKVRVQYVGPAPAAPNSLPSQPIQTQANAPAARPVILTQPASEPAPDIVRGALPSLSNAQAPQPARADDQRGYFLQAGSFADLGNAHSLRSRLRGLGAVSVVQAQVNGTAYYRVMVGPWSSRAEAERAQARLVEAGTKAIVIARLN